MFSCFMNSCCDIVFELYMDYYTFTYRQCVGWQARQCVGWPAIDQSADLDSYNHMARDETKTVTWTQGLQYPSRLKAIIYNNCCETETNNVTIHQQFNLQKMHVFDEVCEQLRISLIPRPIEYGKLVVYIYVAATIWRLPLSIIFNCTKLNKVRN